MAPSPAGAGATKARLSLPQPSFDDAHDLMRRKDIRFTSEPLGLALGSTAMGGHGCNGQAPPFLPQGLNFF